MADTQAADIEPHGASGMERLTDAVASGMAGVNALIRDKAGSNVAMIPEVANHLIASGGKRMRPMLTLATAQLFGYRGDGDVKLATAVEFMHTATLLHDDVVDESGMRRGKPAARMIWGNQASVLVGDFLLGQAFRLMVEVGSLEALDVLSSAAATISEGEVLQLSGTNKLDLGRDHYMRVITAKTATLFAAAAAAGPLIAGRPEYRAPVYAFGLDLGIAFQLIDDVLDFAGDPHELGKNIGDDFREGKATLPVLRAFARGSAEDRAFWRRCVENGDYGAGDLERAVALLRDSGALDEAREEAAGYARRATRHLAALPAHPMRDILAEMVEFTTARLS